MIKEVCNMARAYSESNLKSVTSRLQFSIQEKVLSTIQRLGITLFFFDDSSGHNTTDKFHLCRMAN